MAFSAKAWARLIYPGVAGNVRVIDGVDVPFGEWQANRVGIPDGDASGTSIGLDFGSIASATAVIFKNNNNSDMKVSLPAFNLVPGGVLLIIQPTKSAGLNPLASATVTTTATQSGAGRVDTIVASGTPAPPPPGGGGGGGTPGFIQINAANSFIQKNAANDFITIG